MKRLFALASLMLAAMTTCASAFDVRKDIEYYIPSGSSSGSAVTIPGIAICVRGLSLFSNSTTGLFKVQLFAKATTPVLGIDQPLMTEIIGATLPPRRFLNTNCISISTTSPSGKLWVIAASYTGASLPYGAKIDIGIDGQ